MATRSEEDKYICFEQYRQKFNYIYVRESFDVKYFEGVLNLGELVSNTAISIVLEFVLAMGLMAIVVNIVKKTFLRIYVLIIKYI